MKNSTVWVCFICWALLLSGSGCHSSPPPEDEPPNILLVTLDDMGYGTTGVEGCRVPEITPNIDKLASEGILFTHGFVMSPLCGPSRSAILSGRYPHCNGVMGHGQQPPPLWQQPEVVTPTITKYLHDMGYTTGAILKNSREINNVWDVKYSELPFGVGFHDRNPASFYERTRAFIASARNMKKPFFLYANPIDPHRPWVDTEQEKQMQSQWNPERPYPQPSRRYDPDDIEVPSFLPDLPEIRENLVPYYESLHRGDECIGGILRALKESGEDKNTLVFFLSDHGMAAIGGKGTLYHAGTRTPVIVRWPGKIKEGLVDEGSIISSIDIVPTLLDAIGFPPLEGIEGRSFLNVLTGKAPRSAREYAYTASNYFHQPTPEQFLPQRAIIDKAFCYIWNSYVIRSSGEQRFMRSWMDVVQPCLNGEHPELSEKINAIVDKPVEELFDLEADPGCWNNLAEKPEYNDILEKYRKILLEEMTASNDPELSLINN
jgi:N-sulfoglucosamine sulfohydrolase